MAKGIMPVILLDCELRSQQGLLASFGFHKVPIIALSSEKNCLAFKSRFVNTSIISPSFKDGERYIKFLLDLPYRGVLIYSEDISAELVSLAKDKLLDGGYLVNVAQPDKFQTAFDKWQCYQYCKNIGVNAPVSYLADNLPNARNGFAALSGKCIIKATRLAGGIYRKIDEEQNFEKNYREMEAEISSAKNAYKKSSLIVQEIIDCKIEDIWCSESLYDKTGKSSGVLSIQKMRTCFNSDGTFGSRLYAGKVCENQRLEELTEKLLDNLNWKGFVHLDWIYSKKAKDYFLTDFNPRLPGFSNLLFRSGFDMGYGYYADLLNLPFKTKKRKCVYYECFRLPGDISGGIGAILKKRITLKSFILSYLYIFNMKYKKVFDVFTPEDPIYTFLSWHRDLVAFALKRINKLFKK